MALGLKDYPPVFIKSGCKCLKLRHFRNFLAKDGNHDIDAAVKKNAPNGLVLFAGGGDVNVVAFFRRELFANRSQWGRSAIPNNSVFIHDLAADAPRKVDDPTQVKVLSRRD